MDELCKERLSELLISVGRVVGKERNRPFTPVKVVQNRKII